MDQRILDREKTFHDGWAESVDPETVNVEAVAEACTMPETRYILLMIDKMGGLKGKEILEIGCGCGEASVYFASQGAIVTATDISDEMVKLTEKVAALHNVRLTGMACSADALPFADGSFDMVYAANVLHHVDIGRVLDETKRVLRPGGYLLCWDPIKYNPAIGVYRRLASGVRSVDEHPVDRHYIKEIEGRYSRVISRGFWLSTCLLFVKYYFIDKVDPSKERYWKKIVDDADKVRLLYQRLERVDKYILKWFPFMKWMCWNMVVIGKKGR